MIEEKFSQISDVADYLIENGSKVQLLYAFNATGKTRLSMEFKNKVNEIDEKENAIKRILYFNAFTEDLFTWNNDLDNDEDRFLKYDKRTYFGRLLEEQQQFEQIVENYQAYVGKAIVPEFNDIFVIKRDEFGNPQRDKSGNEVRESYEKSVRFRFEGQVIKISRGEERIFIWSIFLTLVEIIIEDLSEAEEISDFKELRYIYIDDPISSLDDSNIISSAIHLKNMVSKAVNTNLKFIISTHQALFYNVLYNEIRWEKSIPSKQRNKLYFVMKRIAEEKEDIQYNYLLSDIEKDSPFGYHLRVREELRKAVQNDKVEKFHYALFRNLAEKTATFLGYGRWEQVLIGLDVAGFEITKENVGSYTQLIDFYTHNRHADLEYRELLPHEKNTIINLFKSFDTTYHFYKE